MKKHRNSPHPRYQYHIQNSSKMLLKLWKLGLMNYDTALKIQLALARKHLDAMMKRIDDNYDTLLLVEHKPVYTVGIRDDTSLDQVNRLKELGADFRKTSRGGLITFHGPGQLIAYPVLNLKHFKTSVKWYVNSLEETVIAMCSELGVNATRSEHTGVWVGDDKIAAIGIHATRYVTTHGISINCDNDLVWFNHINPCGLEDKGVTSLTRETGQRCSVNKMSPLFIKSFENVFKCKCETIDDRLQEEILNGVYNKLTERESSYCSSTASKESVVPWQVCTTYS